MSDIKWVVVDVESDGPYPPDYSMVCFGAVIVDRNLNKTFYGKTKPISKLWIPEALAISGVSRAEHETFQDPKETMEAFQDWLNVNAPKRIFVSDNPCYDWCFMNYYLHKYLGKNPFGFSGRRIGDIYAGLTKYPYGKWKHLRKTNHTHNPVDDAKGNAEAILAMIDKGFKLTV